MMMLDAGPIRVCRRQANPTILFGPAVSLQAEAIPVIELDAFLFEQALLEAVTAMAGESVGYLALRVDDAMPGYIGCRVEVLEYMADKAGAPWQSGHRGDLPISGNPTLWNATDYSANRRGGFVSSVRGGLQQLALRRHRQLSFDPRGQEDTHGVTIPWPGVRRYFGAALRIT